MNRLDSHILFTIARLAQDGHTLTFSKMTVCAQHVVAARQHRGTTCNTRLLLVGGLHVDVWDYFYPNVQWMLWAATRSRWVTNDRVQAQAWAAEQRGLEQAEWRDALVPRVAVGDVLEAYARGEDAIFALLREIGVLATEPVPGTDDYIIQRPPSEADLREPMVVECSECRGARGRPCGECHGSGRISLIHSVQHHGPGDVNDPVQRESETSQPATPDTVGYTGFGPGRVATYHA